MIVRKTPSELEKMRKSGLLVYEILSKLSGMCVEGAGTMDLENAALVCRHHHTTVHKRRLAGVLVHDEEGERVDWDLTRGSYDLLLAQRQARRRA